MGGIGIPPFEFRKTSGHASRVLIRDLDQAWYHRGLRGVSASFPGTVTYLRSLIDQYQPEEVVRVGNSMGGYGAILFGCLIRMPKVKVIAFCPQTFIGPLALKRAGDHRWSKELGWLYRRVLFKPRCFDLESVVREARTVQIEIHTPDVAFDALHAAHHEPLNQVEVIRHPGADHELVRGLRDRGELVDLLAR